MEPSYSQISMKCRQFSTQVALASNKFMRPLQSRYWLLVSTNTHYFLFSPVYYGVIEECIFLIQGIFEGIRHTRTNIDISSMQICHQNWPIRCQYMTLE